MGISTSPVFGVPAFGEACGVIASFGLPGLGLGGVIEGGFGRFGGFRVIHQENYEFRHPLPAVTQNLQKEYVPMAYSSSASLITARAP